MLSKCLKKSLRGSAVFIVFAFTFLPVKAMQPASLSQPLVVKFEKVATTQNVVQTAQDGAITVTTDNNKSASYQLASQRFPVKTGEIVCIPYEITVASGGRMSLGLLNTARKGWYGTELILEAGTHKGVYEQVVPAGQTEASLVLRNYHLKTAGQSIFTVKSAKVEKKPFVAPAAKEQRAPAPAPAPQGSVPTVTVALALEKVAATQNVVQTARDGAITVTTDNNKSASYQLASQRFQVKAGEIVCIPYEITVAAGGRMSLGLLNTARKGWYGTELILEAGTHKGVYEQVVPAGQTEASLVLRNYHLTTAGQSIFTVKSTKVERKPGVAPVTKEQPVAAPVPVPTVVVALALDKVAATQNTVKKGNGGEVTVTTDKNTSATYQLASQRFPVKGGDTIRVPYEITVAAGGKISLGLLNTTRNGWYGTELILGPGSHKGVYERVVPEGQTEAGLVFRNYHLGVAGQSTFTVKSAKAEIEKKRLTAAEAAAEAERERQDALRGRVRQTFAALKVANEKVYAVEVFNLLSDALADEIILAITNKIVAKTVGDTPDLIKTALKNEALKSLCLRRITSDPSHAAMTADEKRECAERAFFLIQQGREFNLMYALGKATGGFKTKKKYDVTWEEAESIGNFIRQTGLHDQALAKRYYDLATQGGGMGLDAKQARERFLLILESEEGDPRRLSNAQEYFTEHMEMLTAHLMSDPTLTPKKYYENQARQKLKDAFDAEVTQRTTLYNRVYQRIIDESNRDRLRFDRNDELGTRDVRLIEDTQALIATVMELQDGANQRGGSRFNYNYFAVDPNLAYCLDADRAIPAVTTVDQMEAMCNELILVYEANPGMDRATYTENLRKALLIPLNDSGNDKPKKARLRARMMRAFTMCTQGVNAFDPNPILAKRRFAFAVAQNEGRCPDGIDEWLTDFELSEIYKAPKDAGFSLSVSQLIMQKKSEFLNMHQPSGLPEYANVHEFNPKELGTTGILLVKQRMRLGFSLPISFSAVNYPNLAGTTGATSGIYNPVEVVKRFFKGGTLNYVQRDITQGDLVVARSTVPIPSFKPDDLVALVRTAWLNNIIRDDMVTEEIQKDWTLKQAFNRVYGDMTEQENAYFANKEAKAEKYKPAVFKRLICRSGFLIDETETGFY